MARWQGRCSLHSQQVVLTLEHMEDWKVGGIGRNTNSAIQSHLALKKPRFHHAHRLTVSAVDAVPGPSIPWNVPFTLHACADRGVLASNDIGYRRC